MKKVIKRVVEPSEHESKNKMGKGIGKSGDA